MTTTAPKVALFPDRPPIGPKAASSGLVGSAGVPGSSSPRTPLLGRSISSQFGSPSGFRSDQEETVVYEIGARHLSAGFAGESRPRCIYSFNPDSARRFGDYRSCYATQRQKSPTSSSDGSWAEGYELYRTDLRNLDLALVEDRLERAVRSIHTDHLQLDQKSRKAVLLMPTLLPTPLVEIVLKILFNHTTQTPSVVLLTTPFLACVSAGLRNALVVDIGWQEAVVTAIGEYKEILQRRSVRAGRELTREMAKLLEEEIANRTPTSDGSEGVKSCKVNFQDAEEVTKRMGWCRPRNDPPVEDGQSSMVKLPLSRPHPLTPRHLHIPFQRLSRPAEITFFTDADNTGGDDHNLSVLHLVYRALLALPVDVRAICIARIIITGGVSALPGLKQRLLEELSHLIETRQWNAVQSYGSAAPQRERILKERSANIARHQQQKESEPPLSPTKKPIQESVPHMDRIHDDRYDDYTQKAERSTNKSKTELFKGVVRGVETLGAWTGASLMANLRVKGVHDIERDDFLKHGLRDEGTLI